MIVYIIRMPIGWPGSILGLLMFILLMNVRQKLEVSPCQKKN